MGAIVECVPNFSEGQRLEVVDAIVNAIASVNGIKVLHRTSDYHHNRSVVTFAGAPEAVLEAAFAGIRTASTLIDMEHHQGVHPRLGATDVVPFVPIRDITLQDCVALAHALGRRVSEALSLPVYLYEAAAQRPERRNLADVRRGEYEALKQEIGLPERLPDYGAPIVGNAGAVVIGAREPLIAFNAFLNTSDVAVARAVARAIRHSSGGLAGVKALGLMVGGRAQVSMNLTDYRRTPLHRVIEMIRSECLRYGVLIERTELIGLMPQDALLAAAAWYLQLHDLTPDRILEQQILGYWSETS